MMPEQPDLGYYITAMILALVGVMVAFYVAGQARRAWYMFWHGPPAQAPSKKGQGDPMPSDTARAKNAPAATARYRVPMQLQPAAERGNVIVAGVPGDGKTQVLIDYLVYSVGCGNQVVWVNPHLSLHAQDQPVNLYPLAPYLEAVHAYPKIAEVLQAAKALIDERMNLYRCGQDVGHDVVLIVDEWPAIVEACGDEAVNPLKAILREGRKTNVWVALATQDAQVATLGMASGVRHLFRTRWVSDVDDATWASLVGRGVHRVKLGPREWVRGGDEERIYHAMQPGVEDVEYAARGRKGLTFPPLLAPDMPVAGPQPIAAPAMPVAPVAIIQNDDAEALRAGSLRAIAKLIHAGMVPATKSIQTVFGVRAGNGSEYLQLRAALKTELARLGVQDDQE